MADSVQSAIQLLQTGGEAPAPTTPAQDPVSSALSQLQGGGSPGKALPPPVKQTIGAEGLPKAVADIAGDFHPLTQMSVGAKALWDLGALKLKQGSGFQLTPEEQNTIAADRALLENSIPALAGAIVTGAGAGRALTGPISDFAAARVGAALPSFARWLVPAATGGAAFNAATTPTLPGETNERAVNIGAVGGVLGEGLARGLGRVIQPITQNPNVQKLLNYEIIPTPGSAAGGFLKSMEDKLQSVPVIGDFIKNAQIRSRQELAKATIKLATPPGETVDSLGAAAIPEVKQAFSNAYGKVYQGSNIGVDKQLLQDLNAAKNAPIVPMSSDEARKFDHVIQTQILDRLPGSSTIPTSDAKAVIEGNLGKAVNEAAPNSPLQKALIAARDSFRSAMSRSVGPASTELPAINRAYSNFKDVSKAIKQADLTPGATQGLPTPRQLMSASKPGELKDLARAANQVLPSSVPNSGTADRYLASLLLGGLGAGVSTTDKYQSVPYLNSLGPGFWLGLGASPLLYSRTGSRYLVGDLPGQAAASANVRALAPYMGQAGALYLNNQQ